MARVLGKEKRRSGTASHRSNPLVIVENRDDVRDYLRPGIEGKTFRFVSFDWKTLEMAKAGGNTVFPIEDFIPRDVGLKYQEVVDARVRDWYVFRGEDITEFMGISLGAAFNLELCNYFAYAFRYGIALARAVRELEPSHLVAYMIPEDHPYLEYTIKREVVARVARDHGLMLNRYESIGPERVKRLPEVINRDFYHLDLEKKFLFRLVSGIGGMINRFRDRKPEVLVIPEGIFYNPLFERYLELSEKFGYRITFPAINHPPRSITMKMIRKGTVPFYPGKRGWKRVSKKGISTVRRRIAELMVKPEWKSRWELEGVNFSPVFERIIREIVIPDIGATADFALKCMNEMERRPISALIVPNDKARATRIMLETAKRSGIETIYFEHGLTKHQAPSSLVGGKELVDTMLCWGENDLNAYLSQGMKSRRLIERTPPFLADYLPMSPWHDKSPRRVLILQHCYTKDYINGVTHYEEEFLIDLCLGLRDHGIRDLRLKLHPGVSIRTYFEKLVKEKDLGIEVFKNEELKSLILWSDLVIGPISTAVLEVLMLGRDYHCVDLEGIGYVGNSAFDNDMIRVFTSIEEVLDAVRNRESSTNRREVMRSVCGIDRSTTREEVLDSLLDLFNARGRIRTAGPGIENGEKQ